MDDFRFAQYLSEVSKDALSGPINPFVLRPFARTSLIEFGTPLVMKRHLTDAQVAARIDSVRRWIAGVAGKRTNAAFLDTTTLVTIEALLLSSSPSDYLSPLTLFDLANFVNSVVLFDNIFHLENRHVMEHSLNLALGNEPVIINLPVKHFSPETYGDDEISLSGILMGLWREAKDYISELDRASKHPDNVLYADTVEIKAAWASLGFDVAEPFSYKGRDNWASGGPELLAQLMDASLSLGTSYKFVMNGWRISESQLYRVVSEANCRSLFNFMVGYLLELPYLPNSFRMPFRRFLLRRATTVHHHLLSLATIEAEYKERAKAFPIPIRSNLQLPFFTAAILAKISSLDEFLEELAIVRSQADGFRRHRSELELALQQGDLKVAKALQDALSDDAKQLGSKFPYAPLVAGTVGALASLGSSLPAIVIGVIAILSAAAQFPPAETEKLKRRVFAPHMWFLTNLSDAANGLTNALPKIEQLWGPVHNPSHFVDVFSKTATLEQ
jgi:hypothetical protein